MSKKTPWARIFLDGAPHPHRDQVHIHLAQFGPRARNPRICRGESSSPAAETISIGFGSATGPARGPAQFGCSGIVEGAACQVRCRLLWAV
jgi:hypothetical protein